MARVSGELAILPSPSTFPTSRNDFRNYRVLSLQLQVVTAAARSSINLIKKKQTSGHAPTFESPSSGWRCVRRLSPFVVIHDGQRCFFVVTTARFDAKHRKDFDGEGNSWL
ncbi:hypothetical protein NL676_016667 [Syzygium grande]|nr:hypothetical protein NL676_016667 [Syzygium grande]